MLSVVHLAASLLHAASLEASADLRLDAVSSTLAPQGGAPRENRASVSAVPGIAAMVRGMALETSVRYAPRLVAGQGGQAESSVLVMHVVEGRIETTRREPWQAEALAYGSRGWRDTRLDLGRREETSLDDLQAATTGSVHEEEFRTAARFRLALGERTTLEVGAGWRLSRAAEEQPSVALPQQRRTMVDAAVVRLASERDTLRLAALAHGAVSGEGPAARTTAFASVIASWTRRLSDHLRVSLGGGASFERYVDVGDGNVLPEAEAALAWGGAELNLRADGRARVTTLVDRFTGSIDPFAEATASLTWRWRERLALTGSAHGGSRLDGATAVGVADARLVWTPQARLALEVGVSRRWQEDRRPGVPSFVENAVFAGMSWATDRPEARPSREEETEQGREPTER